MVGGRTPAEIIILSVNCFLCQVEASDDLSRIVMMVGVLVAFVLVGAVAMLKLRRRLLDGEDSAGVPLSLHDLRRMHAEGTMNDEEFEKAKAAMIGGASSRAGAENNRDERPAIPDPGAPPNQSRP